jgi:hypothetical protein
MLDVSGFGLTGLLIATSTYPVGVPLTQFAADADPLDMSSMDIAEGEMGLNGDLIVWERAQVIKVQLAVIPGSADDIALQILFDANRPAQGNTNVQDLITLTIIYPGNNAGGVPSQITFILGKLTAGMPGRSVSSSGKMKTKTYHFIFQNKVGG